MKAFKYSIQLHSAGCALMGTLVMAPLAAQASGGDVASHVVSYSQIHPEKKAMPVFLNGHLGVLWPSYQREYLMMAYRQMEGLKPLSADDMKLYPNSAKSAEDRSSPVPDYDANIKTWLAARKQAGAPDLAKAPQFGVRESVYSVYLPNCMNDAFIQATATLNQRVKEHGENAQWIQLWIAGQDRVFSQCDQADGAFMPLPLPLPAAAPEWLKKDYAYQDAATWFYYGKYDQAQKKFAAIAADASSPWQEWSDYLVVRSWRALNNTPDGYKALKRQVLPWPRQEMALRLQRLATQAKNPVVREAADDMYKSFRSRLQTQLVWQETWQAMNAKEPLASISGWVGDERWLWVLMTGAERQNDWLYQTRSLGKYAILSDTENADKASQTAFDQWKKTHKTTWLASAMMSANADNAQTAELVKASRELGPENLLYMHMAWNRARIALMQAKYDQARDELKQAASYLDKETLGTRQAFEILNLRAAPSLDETVKHLALQPIGMDYLGENEAELDETVPKEDKNGSFLDESTQMWLYRHFTADELLKMGQTEALPKMLRIRLLSEAWQRAAMTGQDKIEADALQVWVTLDSGNKAIATVTGKDVAEQRFIMARIMLKDKGIPGLGRTDLRSSYSLPDEEDSYDSKQEKPGVYSLQQLPPAFHDKEMARAVTKQYVSYQKNSTTEWMGKQILPWVSAHPDLPGNAALLAVLVRASRYGEPHTATSRQAFNLLHKLYPNSTDAINTKYYY